MNYDVLVVGSGIGGMESSLKLGDMGYKVLLVEKEASIGGKMILLSKVFPTLDCASCISTPKMAAAAHHPNVDLMVYSEVEEIERSSRGTFNVRVRKKPTYVNPSLCTGCRQCETACNVAVPDQFNASLAARRAAYIAFPQAVPKKAVIEKEGSSPCTFTCPAGIKAHGYVALTRSGKYDEAFNLVLGETPLVGSLGRACYAPCEGECTRGLAEGAVPVRRIKRFIADRYYQGHRQPVYSSVEKTRGHKVAVVGSGPAGLTAAYQLALKGYEVKVFEAEPLPGGMLRTALPSFRLPKAVVDRDIENVTALGVVIETGVRVEKIGRLKEEGFDAVFMATGTNKDATLGVKGEKLEGVRGALDFLGSVNLGAEPSLEGKTVLVAGGGNVAVDSARAAVRLGAKKVIIQYRRGREDMPAHRWEVEAALSEGVDLQAFCSPVEFNGENGRLAGVQSVRMQPGEPDSSGRKKPVPVKGSEFTTPADLVITAVGLSPSTGDFEKDLKLNGNGTFKVNPETLQTSVPYVFAGGDAVTGPSMIVKAVGQGKRAAYFIDQFLSGESLEGADYDRRLGPVDQKAVLGRQESLSRLEPVAEKEIPLAGSKGGFNEVEMSLTEEEARYSSGRCLDCGVCSECSQCAASCPAIAVDLGMREEKRDLEVGSVIVSTGFKLFPADAKPQYGYGKYKNVITGMQMDRLLAPTRPFNAILRPGDGKVPDSIAYILCTGSRDKTVGNPLCSRVCCMYSIKQNQLIMGSLPLADVTVYYIDIRAFSKGYEEFYNQAGGMGANFVKGRVAGIDEQENGNLVLTYEDIDGGGVIQKAEHDLVVLSVGILPNTDPFGLFTGVELEQDDFAYVKEADEDVNPGKTSIDGVFVAGTASGAKDIPDTILHAGAAVAQAAAYVERIRRGK
ncbi:MAG: glutamate synthase [Peptococcaceae bacterium BICA1-7]|nr:MAG: glutamate synthase [Peptococcaceae bacterium BICA1-7]HBV99435.1 FAD-binding protein [Desulfotomaculum sp.]